MKRIFYRKWLQRLIVVWLPLMFSLAARAQEQPPRPISVRAVPGTGLNFGAFYQNTSGGSVVVYPDGSRIATGGVVLVGMGYTFSPAFLR